MGHIKLKLAVVRGDADGETQCNQRGGEEGMSASCCLLTDVFVSPLLVAGRAVK